MSVPFDSRCLECHLGRNLALARQYGDERQVSAFARDLLEMYLAAPADVGSPWFAPQVARLLHDRFGLPLDRFRAEKEQSNRFVLERLEQVRSRMRNAADPVLAGLRLAIVGNYLDFSALQGKVSFDTFAQMLDGAENMALDAEIYRQFRQDLAAGGKLLYLTDNAGEIGFDRVFAEAVAEAYPGVEITFCVRGGPALNDATREDAAAVGLPFPVIDNGNQIPGTHLPALGQEARQALAQADIVFAKGMANVETMLGCGYNVYYAFLVKCDRFSRLFGVPLMTPMLVREGQGGYGK